ncbi:PLP-dependent aminotransferase family protein [Rhodococcus sp. BP-149]|uniref:MocR-like transcription factor YczR n=3 Tax=Rhodococcus TaxID=1827 RepID=UPI001C9B4820|nr:MULTISPECIES: PLP-dependent aminotransferase family protein [unclassified Rhodococcus (in: high G+C Gram-positive bacteria)]MBY6686645.1 PLP-dependent aminotransferase family protein [Rhodococcus sp. BP-288]MBY6695355.1 PLP-dependent aminotransferase family protein [Rhodococcus sp. BP-188]MBY6700137.1 PLP-dependent aminotransferase family protein [Rhodococcus sp. BP-285]MBY6704840.1 PLP-dependent aminotransferase family protein [Rhodococcus sp. BP-283]MBY6713262.1 PLP-dependent aminotransfe
MVTRVIGASTLSRDLGHWRPSGRHRPVYRALADGIRLLVHDGRIPLGVALPSERDLAGALSLSRTTVTNTYAALRDEGYLLSRQGSRSTVALPRTTLAGRPARAAASVIDLTHAAVTAPSDEVTQAYAAALEALPAYYTGHGIEPVGLATLRQALARRYDERGLPTSPDQIMVTSGAQQAWRLLLEVLVSPGDRVVVDHPTYPNALEAIRRTAARAVPVPLRPREYSSPGSARSSRRWDLDAIRDATVQTGARMAYVLPDFHNPTGALLDVAGRAELASNARRTGTTLVVDESMADLWLDEAPPAPVAAVGHPGTVVTVGSASKAYWGGLRVGWIRASPSLISRLATSRAAVDIGTPIMDQLACAALIERHEEILVPRRAELRGNRDALTAALARHLPDWSYDPAPGGLSLWVQMPAAASTALAAIAPAHGVALAAGPRFGVEGAFERHVRLPYTEGADRLEAAIDRIAFAYQSLKPTDGDYSAVVL